MKNIKVSIITISFNAADTIQDAIDSVAQQHYPNIEYIVVDGGSTDSSVAIIEANEHVISKWISEPDGGLYDAMNKGVKMATGALIGMLNADDFLAGPTAISALVERFTRSEGCDGVYADLDYVAAENTNKVTRKWRSGKYSENSFKWGWMPPHPTFYIKKTCYERYGNYRLDMGSAADYELMLRMVGKHALRMQYLPEVLVKMRAGGVSNASFDNRKRANAMDALAWEINGLKPYWFTRYLKPLRKVIQYF